MAFNRLDLPTLGRPTRATVPQRVGRSSDVGAGRGGFGAGTFFFFCCDGDGDGDGDEDGDDDDDDVCDGN